MNKSAAQSQISYFGKLPSYGDFVKNTSNLALVSTLDQWVSTAMELLAADPRWKIIYDATPPFHFAFLGSRSRLAIGGHLRVSQDESQRRFPFLTAVPLDIAHPLAFVARSPLVLAALWTKLGALTSEVTVASDPTQGLQQIASSEVGIGTNFDEQDTAFENFVEHCTVGQLERLLNDAGHESCVRRIVLALGLLLQPVAASGASRLDKGLRLPLPADPATRSLVASLWMYLIACFLAHADVELLLLLDVSQDKSFLIVGFSGASSLTLLGMMNPIIGQEHHVVLEDPYWVESQLGHDAGIAKLASYLDQDSLNLRVILNTFREAFAPGI